MHGAFAVGDRCIDRRGDLRAIRPVVLVDDARALSVRQCPRDRREQRAVMLGSVQVDQQARRLAHDQRRVQRLRELPREYQRARIPAAMRVEQRAVRCESLCIAWRDSIAAVFARDDEADVNRRHETSALPRGSRTGVDTWRAARRRSRSIPPSAADGSTTCLHRELRRAPGGAVRVSCRDIEASARHASPAVCAPERPSTRR